MEDQSEMSKIKVIVVKEPTKSLKDKKKGDAYRECMQANIFKKYNSLKDRQLDDHNQASMLIYRSIIKMVEFDPQSGDKRVNMSEDEIIYWSDLQQDIISAGKLLCELGGKKKMLDQSIWIHIPRRFHRDIDMLWNKIDGWKS